MHRGSHWVWRTDPWRHNRRIVDISALWCVGRCAFGQIHTKFEGLLTQVIVCCCAATHPHQQLSVGDSEPLPGSTCTACIQRFIQLQHPTAVCIALYMLLLFPGYAYFRASGGFYLTQCHNLYTVWASSKIRCRTIHTHSIIA